MFDLETIVNNRKSIYFKTRYSDIEFVGHDLEKEIKKTKKIVLKSNTIFKLCDKCDGSGLTIQYRSCWFILNDCPACSMTGLKAWTDEIIQKDGGN